VIVIDASALLELLLRTPAGERVEERVAEENRTLNAPHHIDLEVAHVLRRFVRIGDISAARGQEALDDLAALRLRRFAHISFLNRIWSLRDNLTAYDAAYVALAEELDAILLTADRRLAHASGHCAAIELC
jgi:predicted nucleic acid-binding protein